MTQKVFSVLQKGEKYDFWQRPLQRREEPNGIQSEKNLSTIWVKTQKTFIFHDGIKKTEAEDTQKLMEKELLFFCLNLFIVMFIL